MDWIGIIFLGAVALILLAIVLIANRLAKGSEVTPPGESRSTPTGDDTYYHEHY